MLRKLFGRLAGESQVSEEAAEPEVAATDTHHGFELRAAPIREGKGWRVAGSVLKSGEAEENRQDFVRADTCMSKDDAVDISMRKARQIVDEYQAGARTE